MATDIESRTGIATDESPRTGRSRGQRPKRANSQQQALSNTLAERQREKKRAAGFGLDQVRSARSPAVRHGQTRHNHKSFQRSSGSPIVRRSGLHTAEVEIKTGRDVRSRHTTPPSQSKPTPVTHHTRHAKPVHDPVTGQYRCVKGPRQNSAVMRAPSHRPVYGGADNVIAAPVRGKAGALSSRHELYLFHKANGTLQEFYRMFGLDCSYQ